jgi:hypothetical protein
MTAGGAGVSRRTRRGRRTLVIVIRDKGPDHFTHPETAARMKKDRERMKSAGRSQPAR